jgi:hypothetical protein
LVLPRSADDVYEGVRQALKRVVPAERPQFYGRGEAAEEIVQALLRTPLERTA